LRPCKYSETRPEYPMNAFQLSEIKFLHRPREQKLPGEQMLHVAALSHFVVAVSSVVIARAACLILPWHRAVRVAEPVANIDVGAVTAWYRPPAAAVLEGIIPARLKPRRYHPVPVALAVPLIEIVAVAARRRMAVTAVADFLGQDFLDREDAFVQRVGSYAQLQRERYAGHAGEHLSVPPVNTASPRPTSAAEIAMGIIRFHIDVVRAFGKAGLRNLDVLPEPRSCGNRHATQGGDHHAMAAERRSPPVQRS